MSYREYEPNDIIEICFQEQYYLCRVIRQEDTWELNGLYTEFFDTERGKYGWWYLNKNDKHITRMTELDWALAKMRDKYVRS